MAKLRSWWQSKPLWKDLLFEISPFSLSLKCLIVNAFAYKLPGDDSYAPLICQWFAAKAPGVRRGSSSCRYWNRRFQSWGRGWLPARGWGTFNVSDPRFTETPKWGRNFLLLHFKALVQFSYYTPKKACHERRTVLSPLTTGCPSFCG